MISEGRSGCPTAVNEPKLSRIGLVTSTDISASTSWNEPKLSFLELLYSRDPDAIEGILSEGGSNENLRSIS